MARRVPGQRMTSLPAKRSKRYTSHARPGPAAGTRPAGPAGDDPRQAPQHLAQPGDVYLQGVLRARGRMIAPQPVDQSIPGDRLVRGEQEDRQQRPLLQAADLDGLPVGGRPRAAREAGIRSLPQTPRAIVKHGSVLACIAVRNGEDSRAAAVGVTVAGTEPPEVPVAAVTLPKAGSSGMADATGRTSSLPSGRSFSVRQEAGESRREPGAWPDPGHDNPVLRQTRAGLGGTGQAFTSSRGAAVRRPGRAG